VSPSGDGHPWPLKPFDRQHPVRGLFGDPRIGDKGGKSFHFGVDVSGLDGTAVYGVNGGRVSIDGENITVVEVEGEQSIPIGTSCPPSRAVRGSGEERCSDTSRRGGGMFISRSGAAMRTGTLYARVR